MGVSEKRENREEKLNRELRDHLELDAETKINNGLSADQARFSAQRDFGNTTLVKETTREMWAWSFLERFLQDVRYGVRVFRRNPGFTVVAILTLALGIGANAAMFSIIDAVLLRPLPYSDADRLVSITTEDPSRNITALNVSYTRLQLIQQESHTLESIAGFFAEDSSLVTSGDPEKVPSAIVTGNFFDVFGVTPSLGRGFLREEDQPGGSNVAIISDAFWHSHFGGQIDAIKRSVAIDGRSVVVIGVLPADFKFPFVQPEPQIWFPRVFENPLFTPDRVNSGAAYLTVYGRLRAGETISHAQTELDSLGAAYTKAFPGFGDAQRFTARAAALKESLVGPLRTSLLVLLAGVGFVLLIGCTNLASLLLARATARRKEMAVRRAVGASRGRLVGQLLTESLLLSFLGGGIGVALAACAPLLLRLLPPGTLPRVGEVGINTRVVLFSAVLCALTGVVVGIVPALQVSGDRLHDALKEAARGSTGGAHAGRSRAALVVAQVAVALVLVSSAVLLIESWGKLMHVSPGFDPHDVMSFSFALPQTKYPQRAQQAEFYRRLVESVQAIPGVESAAANTFLPISGNVRFAYFCPQGSPCQGGGKDPVAAVRHITPDYFKTMRIPVVRGRSFNQFDNANSAIVAVINETLANQFFPGQDPIGKFVIQFRGNVQTLVVGVVGDVKYAGLNAPDTAELYMPQQQSPIPVAASSLVVRTDGSRQSLIASVRGIVSQMDSSLPMSNIISMDEAISASVAQPRLTADLTAAFAFLALLLAAIGIYGVMAYAVLQRKHEMAIRIALGASPGSILKLVTKQGVALVVCGVTIGILASLALTRLFAGILFHISAHDPLTLAGVAAMLIAVGLLACYIPARRAMSVDPITALREE
jgi:putative ABC transport system permease protein